MLKVNFLIVMLSVNWFANGDFHNQQQIGETNYEADLEDVSFLIFYDGIPGDYDYSYDYSDLTVKPEEGSSTTESSSHKPITFVQLTTELNNESSTLVGNKTDMVLDSSTKKPNNTPEHPLNTENFQIPVVVVTEGTKLKKGYISSSTLRKKPIETETLPKRTCLHGFILDEKNRCKKITRKSSLNARSPKPPLPLGLRYPQAPQQLKEPE